MSKIFPTVVFSFPSKTIDVTPPRDAPHVRRPNAPLATPSGTVRPTLVASSTSARRSIIAHVSKPPSGHGSVGDNISPNVVSGAGDVSVSSPSDWAAEAAALEAASQERESSLSELQAMLASMGQPAPPPPPAAAPPASVTTPTTTVTPTLDVLPPPSPVKLNPQSVAVPVGAPVVVEIAPKPVVESVPEIPAPVAQFVVAPVPLTPPVVNNEPKVPRVTKDDSAEVGALFAAQAPPVTSQQCTDEVGGLLSRHQKMVIPPPLSRGRFKMKMVTADGTSVSKPKSKGPPLGTTKEEVKAVISELAVPSRQKKMKKMKMRVVKPKPAVQVESVVEVEPDMESFESVVEQQEVITSEQETQQTLLSEEEDMLFAEAVLAEAKLLAEEEAALEAAHEETIGSTVADAVAADLMFDAVSSDFETPAGSPVGVGLTSEFPEATQWFTPKAEQLECETFATPENSDLEFPNKLARAVRSIQNWFTGVPFLTFDEPPAMVEQAVKIKVETVVTPVQSGAVARALRMFDAGTFAASSAVDLRPKTTASDPYEMNDMIVLDLESLEASLEEMDYTEYLEFHGMQVLEGTPPQVLEMMVAELKGVNGSTDIIRALDAKDAQRAFTTSTTTTTGYLAATKERVAEESTKVSKASESSASSQSSSVSDLKSQLAALEKTTADAKADAEQSKEQLASLYARNERVDSLAEEAEKWKQVAENAERNMVAFMETQTARKAKFVSESEERIAEAVAAADSAALEAKELREMLSQVTNSSEESQKTHEDVSVQVKTLKTALQEKQAALEKAEADAMHLARITDAAAATRANAVSPDELRAARVAAAEAAEDAAAKITEAAEKLLDAKARAVRMEEVAQEKDDELASVRAELENVYAAAEEAKRSEQSAKEAAAAAAFCAAANLVAAMRRDEDFNALVFA